MPGRALYIYSRRESPQEGPMEINVQKMGRRIRSQRIVSSTDESETESELEEPGRRGKQYRKRQSVANRDECRKRGEPHFSEQ